MAKHSSLILDVGCDSGLVAQMLESKGFRNLAGIDLANRFTHSLNISYSVAENTNLPFRSGTFDVIFARKFASMSDAALSLTEFHRILKDDGKLIIEVPNVKRLKSRLYRALSLTPPYPPKYFPHLHMTPFKRMLCEKNFSILEVKGDYVFIPMIGNVISALKLNRLERILGRMKPTLCLHLAAICKKRLITKQVD
jgi:SAM-dependent methyltransferase